MFTILSYSSQEHTTRILQNILISISFGISQIVLDQNSNIFDVYLNLNFFHTNDSVSVARLPRTFKF